MRIVATLGLIVAIAVALYALPTGIFMLLIAFFLAQANWEALQSVGGWSRRQVAFASTDAVENPATWRLNTPGALEVGRVPGIRDVHCARTRHDGGDDSAANGGITMSSSPAMNSTGQPAVASSSGARVLPSHTGACAGPAFARPAFMSSMWR